MYGSKQTDNVVLFPLCDARGDLIDALCDTTDSPTPREDAMVFAWRLELPDTMNLAKAANALLMVALSVPRETWTRRQLLIVRELMTIAGREVSMPLPKPESTNKPLQRLTRSPISPRAAAPRQVETLEVVPKEEKQWWKLVGRQETDNEPGRQRKTRKGRVSRKPV